MSDIKPLGFKDFCVEVLLIIQARYPGRVFTREEAIAAVEYATSVGSAALCGAFDEDPDTKVARRCQRPRGHEGDHQESENEMVFSWSQSAPTGGADSP